MNTYALNIAVNTGKANWNGTGYIYKHFAFIELGDDEKQARAKAAVFVSSLGREDYEFTFRITPLAAMTSETL